MGYVESNKLYKYDIHRMSSVVDFIYGVSSCWINLFLYTEGAAHDKN